MADELAKDLRKWALRYKKRLGIGNDERGEPYACIECRLPTVPSVPKADARADLYIHTKTGKAHIFVEVERSSGPCTVHNVAKYWLWDELGLDSHKRGKIHLIQVRNPRLYTKHNYKSHIETTNFIAEKMKKELQPRFKFHPIADFIDEDRWEQEAFYTCKKKIEDICLRGKASLLKKT